jgi:hypothetical protein
MVENYKKPLQHIDIYKFMKGIGYLILPKQMIVCQSDDNSLWIFGLTHNYNYDIFLVIFSAFKAINKASTIFNYIFFSYNCQCSNSMDIEFHQVFFLIELLNCYYLSWHFINSSIL